MDVCSVRGSGRRFYACVSRPTSGLLRASPLNFWVPLRGNVYFCFVSQVFYVFLWLTYCMINSTKAECLFLLCMTPLCLYDSACSHFHLKDELLPQVIGKRDFNCISLWYSAQVFLRIFCFVFQKKRSLLVCIKSDCKRRKSIVSSSNLTPTLTRVPSSYWLILQVTVSWLESPHPYLRLCALSLNNVITWSNDVFPDPTAPTMAMSCPHGTLRLMCFRLNCTSWASFGSGEVTGPGERLLRSSELTSERLAPKL